MIESSIILVKQKNTEIRIFYKQYAMIPLRSEIKSQRVPIITIVIISINLLVVAVIWGSTSQQGFIGVYQFGVIPSKFLAAPTNIINIRNLFTAMFIHASWFHLIINMVYLSVFGNSIEDLLGRLPYLFFYLAGGVGATMAHIFTKPGSIIPIIGASGAISAILGAYLVLYPKCDIETYILFIRGIRGNKNLPAALIIGFWFILQFFQFAGVPDGPAVDGTNFFAHIGGLIFGVLYAHFFIKPHKTKLDYSW